MSASSMSRTPHAACHSSGWCAEMLRQVCTVEAPVGLRSKRKGARGASERLANAYGEEASQVSSSEWCGKKWPNPSFNNPGTEEVHMTR